MSPRATIAYLNGRRTFKPANGGKVYPRRAEFAPDEADPRLENFRAAYLQMARVGFRPQAATDGVGNIQLTAAELSDKNLLRHEAAQYAAAFVAEEDEGDFHIGCSDFASADIFCWSIEAARQLATGTAGRATALALLRLAIAKLERAVKRGAVL